MADERLDSQNSRHTGDDRLDASGCIRTIVADPHAIVRAALSAILGHMPEVQVLGDAGDTAALLATLRSGRPDVLLVDAALGGAAPAALVGQLRRLRPRTQVLILSSTDQPIARVRAVLDAGGCGFLPKTCSAMELRQAIHAASLGHQYIDGKTAKRLALAGCEEPEIRLSRRLVDVLTLLARGMQNKQIAHVLGLSAKTVDVHRGRLMRALGINSVAGLTLYAVRHGLVDA